MDVLVKDNFLNSVDTVRTLGLNSEYTCSEDLEDVGWKGYRSEELQIETINRSILNTVSQYYSLSGYDIRTYFHLTYERTKDTLSDFHVDKYHFDLPEYAGLIYLTPNPPKESGTTINSSTRITVENVYNRLVSYPGKLYHAPTDLFGDSKDNGRMTITFFIDPL